MSALIPLALGTGISHSIPYQKRYEAQEGGRGQNTPEGEITAVLGLRNVVQRTGRRNNR